MWLRLQVLYIINSIYQFILVNVCGIICRKTRHYGVLYMYAASFHTKCSHRKCVIHCVASKVFIQTVDKWLCVYFILYTEIKGMLNLSFFMFKMDLNRHSIAKSIKSFRQIYLSLSKNWFGINFPWLICLFCIAVGFSTNRKEWKTLYLCKLSFELDIKSY